METNRLQTLDRGIAVLMAVANSSNGLSVAELAKGLDVHRAIAYRLVGTLAAHAMVQRLPDGRIVLGSGALVLAARYDTHLRNRARPLIEALARRTRATAFLSVAQGDDCVAVVTAEPPDVFLNVSYRIGSRHPLTRGAAGIAILSSRPEKPDDSEKIRTARRDGFSLTRGELQRGAVGVSSPVPLSPELYPALECSVGVVAMDDFEISSAASAVLSCADELAEEMIRAKAD